MGVLAACSQLGVSSPAANGRFEDLRLAARALGSVALSRTLVSACKPSHFRPALRLPPSADYPM